MNDFTFGKGRPLFSHILKRLRPDSGVELAVDLIQEDFFDQG